MKISVSWLYDFVDFSYSREELMDIFNSLGHEVKGWEKINNDIVFELDTFPHRFDTLGHRGIARELAAAKGLDLNIQDWALIEGRESASDFLNIQVRNEILCLRCCGMTVHDIKGGSSPEWIQKRLRSVGVDPVDNIQDTQMYILLSTGHPVHVFDLNKITDNRIVIRASRPGEKFFAHDGREITMTKDTPVISDPEKIISLAGIADNPEALISGDTDSAAVISAVFDSGAVRKARTEAGIQNELSLRGERGIDIHDIPNAVKQTASLLTKPEGRSARGLVDIYPGPDKPRTVILRQRKVNEILGLGVEEDFITSILHRAGFTIHPQQKGSWKVQVPLFRKDIEREMDLIEEIGRYYGYDRIPSRLPQLDSSYTSPDSRMEIKTGFRQILFHQGFDEVVNDGFMIPREKDLFFSGEEAVEVINSVSLETSFLKNTLLVGLLENIRLNFSRGIQGLHIFEMGRRFFRESNTVAEKSVLAFAGAGRLDEFHWQKESDDIDFFYVKGTLESLLRFAGAGPVDFEEMELPFYEPGFSLNIKIKGENAGHLGVIKSTIRESMGLDKEIYAAELDLEAATGKHPNFINYGEISFNPGIHRTVTFIDSQAVRYKEIKSALESMNLSVLESFQILDRKVDISSSRENVIISLRFTFNRPEKAVQEKEVDEYMQKIIHVLTGKFSFEIKHEEGEIDK